MQVAITNVFVECKNTIETILEEITTKKYAYTNLLIITAYLLSNKHFHPNTYMFNLKHI